MAHITLKNNSFHTSGELPHIGSLAPNFKLTANDLSDKSLQDFPGKKILYTVPSLDTAVCLSSSKKFSQEMKNHPKAHVLVISADLPFAQQRICGSEGIDNIHTLSMMRSKKFAEDYGLLITDGPLAGVLARAVLVVDENNKVVYQELVEEITHEPNYEKALALLS